MQAFVHRLPAQRSHFKLTEVQVLKAKACTHTTTVFAKATGNNGANGAAGHIVPPAWPGRAVIDPNFKPSTQAKKFSLLGSTGSIGTQTLDIVREHHEKFEIVAIAAGRNIDLLAEQIKEFSPSLVSIQDSSQREALLELIADLPQKPEIVAGDSGIMEVASHPDAEAVVTGIVGCAGLSPTCAAISKGKDICLANKETLIAGAPYVLPLARKHDVAILPADSEHSAIFQCIQGLPEGGLRRIILTASGGAFREWPVEKLKTVTVADAIKHPNWSMGKKITVDSASLMNKARLLTTLLATTCHRPVAQILLYLVGEEMFSHSAQLDVDGSDVPRSRSLVFLACKHQGFLPFKGPSNPENPGPCNNLRRTTLASIKAHAQWVQHQDISLHLATMKM